MKIKLLRDGRWNTTGVKDGPFIEGEVGDKFDVDNAFGASLVEAESATEVVAKKPAHQPKKESAKPKKKK